MNLHHRMADNNHQDRLDLVFKKISYPLNFIIPAALVVISLYTLKDYFGGVWELGNFSSPVWHILSQLISQIFNLDQEAVLNSLILFLIALGPLTAYLFIFQITRRHLPAIIASILMQLPLFPFSTAAPAKLILALVDGDAAHVASLSLLPIAGLAFLEYLRSKSTPRLVLFAVMTALMASLSFFSLYILFIVMLFITISEVLIDQGRVKVIRMAYGLLVLLLVIFLVYNVSLIKMLFSGEGQTTLQVFLNFLPLSFFLIPILGTFFFLIFDRRPSLQPIFISLSLTILFWIFHWIRVSFVDTAIFDQDRYGAEVSFAFSFLSGVLLTVVFDLIRGGVLLKKYNLTKDQRFRVAYGLMTLFLTVMLLSLILIKRNV